MSEPIFLGYLECPDDGLRYVDGELYYVPEMDVNGVHAALLDPTSNYGKPAGMDLRVAAVSGEAKKK